MTTMLAPESQPATTPALETIPIPASHRDLLTRPIVGVLTTMGADGWPQSSLVWVDVDGEFAQVNTTLERQKGRNLLADPKVSLLIVDPDDTARYLQIRGEAELRHRRRARAPRCPDAEVHPPPRVLRLDLSHRATGA